MKKIKLYLKVGFTLLIILATKFPVWAQSNDDCLMCHDDPELTTEINGRTISLYVTGKKIVQSVHNSLDCIDCHDDAAVDDFPHDILGKVNCANCHDDINTEFASGIHGIKNKTNPYNAPDCKTCHGKHDILPASNPYSPIYKMNIPLLCGRCHKEGSPVINKYYANNDNVETNFSQKIHGNSFFRKGIMVSATCNDCHGSHKILPQSNSGSTVSIKKIASTCMKCHKQVKHVHASILKGQIWEESPGLAPACSYCHNPHKKATQKYNISVVEEACLKCHNSTVKYNDSSALVNTIISDLSGSVHNTFSCLKCHNDINPKTSPPCKTVKRVDCSICHSSVNNIYKESGHGIAFAAGKENAPYCTGCHGAHNIKSKYDETSPTYRTEIPVLCGECHKTNGKAIQENPKLHEVNALYDFSTSVHGLALKDKGLVVAAVCTDCHTSHFGLGENNPRSSVYRENVPSTCAVCHKGIYETYINGDHSFKRSDGEKKYPTCVDCHSSHRISDVHKNKFMHQVTTQCGSCHGELAETYLETYHGKAYLLGAENTAKCSDCHGAHGIMHVSDSNSMVGANNIVATCGKCHTGSNKKFTGYLTHAKHNDKNNYPVLYYAFWFMTILLLGVFGFFGLHLLLWFPRALLEVKGKKKTILVDENGEKFYIRRFSLSQRVTHFFVIVSFLTLALTGMLLKFPHMNWAIWAMDMLGGVRAAGLLHRFGAIITFGYFGFHLFYLIRTKIREKTPLLKFIFGPNSLFFNKDDISDFWKTTKWFVGLGPKPGYGKFSYWEKFDYFAVFWGVAVIGLSGLLQWFPELFARIFPGWLVNVSQIIHSDEALLATGFIFTIHFFNTHLRPGAFPMDTVIFTGLVSMEEYKHERPREFELLEKSGRLEKYTVKREKENRWLPLIKAMGFFFLAFGLALVILIIYSLLAG